MGYLKYKEQLELSVQQSHGLAALVAAAVVFSVLNILIPLWGSSAAPEELLSKREKGMLTVALNVDGQERGVYFLRPGTTISDVLLTTGATTIVPQKFEKGVGIRSLHNGDKIYLTTDKPASPVVGTMSAAQSLALDLPIDINKANADELVLVPGIGERTAAQIIALRGASGSLRSLEELKELNGIKEKKFNKLKKYFFALP